MPYTSYYPGGWQDSPATTTPIIAASLQNIETGITNATTGVMRANQLQPSDHGWIAWPFAPYNIRATDIPVLTSGTVYVVKIPVASACTITNIVYYVNQAATTLTASENLAALYSGTKSLLSPTGDLTASYGTTGLYTSALNVPQAVAAGYVYAAFYYVASGTALGLGKGDAPSAIVNGGLTAANAVCASADTGRTTTMPPILVSITAFNGAIWAAVS